MNTKTLLDFALATLDYIEAMPEDERHVRNPLVLTLVKVMRDNDYSAEKINRELRQVKVKSSPSTLRRLV